LKSLRQLQTLGSRLGPAALIWMKIGAVASLSGPAQPEFRLKKGCSPAGQQQGDLLHVLTGGREQALGLNLGQSAKARVAMPVELFGVGKAAFNGFLAGRVEAFAQIGQPMGVDLLLEVLPEVARDELLGVLALGAAGTLRALAALAGVRGVFAIAHPVGAPIDDDLPGRAAVAVGLRVIGVLAFVEVPLPVAGAAVAHHPIQAALDDTFADPPRVRIVAASIES
jgi:hypothetical protein